MNTDDTAHTPTGHAHHFLSRLDRVVRSHVELALTLYRDDGLVRFILARARLPEGSSRVAIALADARRGPFLILTRRGGFVTCLAEGMRASEMPVITRSQLDGHMARARELRARSEALLELGDHVRGVYRRLVDAGDELSREQIVAASASATPIRGHLMGLLARVGCGLHQLRGTLVPIVRRTANPRPAARRALRGYWNLAWASGHLAVLSALDGPGLVEMLPPIAGERGPCFSVLTLAQGVISIALRGIWAAGKLGRELLAPYKRALVPSSSSLVIIDAVLGLTMLALRHKRLRAEVQKVLQSPGVWALGQPEITGPLCQRALGVIAEPEKAMAAHRAHGAARLATMTRHLPEGSPWRFARAEDVPEELAMTAGVTSGRDFLMDARVLEEMVTTLPWLARARAEDLYFPRELLRALRAPWHQRHSVAMLQGYCVSRPAAKPAGPTRSAPCPCESGKKFKRCCGEERHMQELPRAA